MTKNLIKIYLREQKKLFVTEDKDFLLLNEGEATNSAGNV